MASKASAAPEKDAEVEREHHVAARKFRPRHFSEVIGQDHIIKPLQRKIVERKVGHAYLFVGQRGCGKTTTARLLAMAMNCPNVSDAGEPCGNCSTCNGIVNGSGAIGLHELDAASKRGVGDMLSLIETMAMGSVARKKVYIIDECHMLTTEASNALLKTLEEPPADTLIILCTTEAQKVLPTIKSRAVTYNFKTVDSETMRPLVEEIIAATGVEIDKSGIEEIIRRGNGSPRDTLTALEGYGGDVEIATSDFTPRISLAVADRDASALVIAIAESINAGIGVPDLSRALMEHWRNCLLFLQAPTALNLSADAMRRVEKDAKMLKTNKVIRLLNVTSEAVSKMSSSSDTRLLLETTLLQVALPETAESIDGLYDYLDDIMAEVKKLSKAVRNGVAVKQESEWPPAPDKAVELPVVAEKEPEVEPDDSPAVPEAEQHEDESDIDNIEREDASDEREDDANDASDDDSYADEDSDGEPSDDDYSSYDDSDTADSDGGEQRADDDDDSEPQDDDEDRDEDSAAPVRDISQLFADDEEDQDSDSNSEGSDTDEVDSESDDAEEKGRDVISVIFHDENNPHCECDRCLEGIARFEDYEREERKAAAAAAAESKSKPSSTKLHLVKDEEPKNEKKAEKDEKPARAKKTSRFFSEEDCPTAGDLVDVIQNDLLDKQNSRYLQPSVVKEHLDGDVLVITVKRNSKVVPPKEAIKAIRDTAENLWVSEVEVVV